MKKEQLLDIINIIKENNNLPRIENIDDTTLLRDDLGLDSFDLAELTVRIEEEFDVDVFEDGLVISIGEILVKLNK